MQLLGRETMENQPLRLFEHIKQLKLSKKSYHICNFIFFPPSSTVLILKSIPTKKNMKIKNPLNTFIYHDYLHKLTSKPLHQFCLYIS